MMTMRLRLQWFGLVPPVAVLVWTFGGVPGARADQASVSPAVQAALAAAVTIPGARADLVALDRPANDCVTTDPAVRVEIARPIDGSGRFAVKLIGTRARGMTCEVWAWARIRVFAQVPVARRAIRAGETLASATRTEEREIRPGHVPALLTAASTADRTLGMGQMIEADAVATPGLRAGESVKILIISGSLAIEQIGHAVPCTRGHNCAVLPSGKRIEGTLVDGRLMVQLP
jgi:hypothetical protein